MTIGSGLRRRRGVLRGGQWALALLLLGAAAFAQEKPKKSDEQVLLEAVGAEWKAGDAAALATRLPAKRRVSLRLPGAEPGEYRAEQAKSILEGYFRDRTFSRVELKACRDATGTFSIEYARTADRRKVKAELLVVLGTEEKRRVVVSVRESP